MKIYNRKFFFEIIIGIFNLIKKIIVFGLEKSIIFGLLISICCYLMLPLKSNIHVIYKLLYIIIPIVERINRKKIIIKHTSYQHGDFCCVDENFFNIWDPCPRSYTIVTSITHIYHIFSLVKLMSYYDFIIYFSHGKKISWLQKKLLDKFYMLQDEAYPDKKKIFIKIIIYSTLKKIPKDKLLKNNSYYILEHKKKYYSLFYS